MSKKNDIIFGFSVCIRANGFMLSTKPTIRYAPLTDTAIKTHILNALNEHLEFASVTFVDPSEVYEIVLIIVDFENDEDEICLNLDPYRVWPIPADDDNIFIDDYISDIHNKYYINKKRGDNKRG